MDDMYNIYRAQGVGHARDSLTAPGKIGAWTRGPKWNPYRKNIQPPNEEHQRLIKERQQQEKISNYYANLKGIPDDLANEYGSFLYKNNGDRIQAVVDLLNYMKNIQQRDPLTEHRISAVQRYLDSLYASAVSAIGWNR